MLSHGVSFPVVYNLRLSHKCHTLGLMLKGNWTSIFPFSFSVLNVCLDASYLLLLFPVLTNLPNSYPLSNFCPWSFFTIGTDFQHNTMFFSSITLQVFWVSDYLDIIQLYSVMHIYHTCSGSLKVNWSLMVLYTLYLPNFLWFFREKIIVLIF